MDSVFAAQTKFRQSLNLQKVKVIRNPNYQRNGTKSYVYLMNRFGMEPTMPGRYRHINKPHQRGLVQHAKHTFHGKKAIGGRLHMEKVLANTGADGSGTGQVTAEDQQNDSEYLCQVSIGTPAQNLLLDFDTGSADLWVFSTELSQSIQGNHNVFDPSKSSTWKKVSSEAWKISYGDGSTASGDVGTDDVTVGGLQIKNQTVELAKTLSDQFAQGTGDGLLGLAFSTINTVTKSGKADPQATPVENMISQSDIPKDAELFTSAFYSDRDNSKTSFYTFGYIDQDLVTASGAEIAWTDIDSSQGFWQFASESTVINGQTISQSGNKAIADTGTTLALVSDQVCEALYKAIPGAKYDQQQQGYVFPTSVTAAQMPKVQVAVGTNLFTIQPEDLAFAPTGDGNWYGGVQSRGDMTFDILGDSFLKSIYAIWDQGNKRFGAVPKIEATQNLSPPASTESTGAEKVSSKQLLAKHHL